MSLHYAAFLAVADEEYGRQIPFAFLERIQAEWKEKLADKARSATAHSLDKTFGWARAATSTAAMVDTSCLSPIDELIRSL
jgi:Regulated-SNARE-like domain